MGPPDRGRDPPTGGRYPPAWGRVPPTRGRAPPTHPRGLSRRRPLPFSVEIAFRLRKLRRARIRLLPDLGELSVVPAGCPFVPALRGHAGSAQERGRAVGRTQEREV